MMEIINPIILLPLILGPIFFIVGFIQLKFPPKKINHIYGYRTKNSMRSQEVWDFAQQFSAKEMIKGGIFFLLLAGVGKVVKVNEIVGIGIVLALLIGCAILLFSRTEKAIYRKFPD